MALFLIVIFATILVASVGVAFYATRQNRKSAAAPAVVEVETVATPVAVIETKGQDAPTKPASNPVKSVAPAPVRIKNPTAVTVKAVTRKETPVSQPVPGGSRRIQSSLPSLETAAEKGQGASSAKPAEKLAKPARKAGGYRRLQEDVRRAALEAHAQISKTLPEQWGLQKSNSPEKFRELTRNYSDYLDFVRSGEVEKAERLAIAFELFFRKGSGRQQNRRPSSGQSAPVAPTKGELGLQRLRQKAEVVKAKEEAEATVKAAQDASPAAPVAVDQELASLLREVASERQDAAPVHREDRKSSRRPQQKGQRNNWRQQREDRIFH